MPALHPHADEQAPATTRDDPRAPDAEAQDSGAPDAGASAARARMSTPALVLRVVGVVAVLALLAVGADLATIMFRERESVVSVTATAADTASITRLVADDAVGRLTVRPGAVGRPAEITSTQRWSDRPPTTRWAIKDGVLTVAATCTTRPLWQQPCSVDLTITVPPGTAVDLSSEAGGITVRGLDGPVTARTTFGDITLHDLTSSAIRAHSQSGRISITSAADTRVVDAVSAVGGVTVRCAAAPEAITATSEQGDVWIAVPADQRYQVHAGSAHNGRGTVMGTVTVTVPENDAAAHQISAFTRLGDIAVVTG